MLHKATGLERLYGMTNTMGMNMIFEIWNVRSLYRSGSLKVVSTELVKYKLDLVKVQM
jgi:hypothetical protein